MKKLYKVNDSMYCIEVLLFIGTYKESEAYLKRGYGIGMGTQEFYSGCSMYLQDIKTKLAFNYIWMPEFTWTINNYVTLSHECLHCAMNTMKLCNIPVAHDNHESLAYLHGFYFGELMNELKEDRR